MGGQITPAQGGQYKTAWGGQFSRQIQIEHHVCHFLSIQFIKKREDVVTYCTSLFNFGDF